MAPSENWGLFVYGGFNPGGVTDKALSSKVHSEERNFE